MSEKVGAILLTVDCFLTEDCHQSLARSTAHCVSSDMEFDQPVLSSFE